MRIIAAIGTLGGMLLRAYLGSAIGYAGWFGYQLWQGSLWRWLALIVVPFWGLVMGVASLPAALLGCGTARIAGSVTGAARWPAMLLGLAVAGFAGSWLFIWYMSTWLELFDWRSRWPWPLAASLIAYLLEYAWCCWRRPAAPPAEG
jgi:hypothetical protein